MLNYPKKILAGKRNKKKGFDKNEKIYKRDFYKIEKVVNYWGITLEAILEESEYYIENSENIKIEKINKRVYIDYDYESKFLKILFKK